MPSLIRWQHARGTGLGLRPAAAFTLILTLGGCANLSPDQGMGDVTALTLSAFGADAVKIRTEDDAAFARERVSSLLRKPLTAENAVQIALLNNRELQAAYAELGVTEAQLARSALPPNPSFSYSLVSGSGALEIERQVAVSVIALLTLPRRQEIAAVKFRAAQFKAMNETLRVAAETRRAYIRAVAASQTVTFLTKSQGSAETVSDLAKRLGETGALSKLDQAREHAFYAELSGQLGVAKLRAASEREKLTRLMGLWGSDIGYRLPEQLKPLPMKVKTIEAAEREAIGNRVDLQMIRLEVEAQAMTAGVTEATRFVAVSEDTHRVKGTYVFTVAK